MRHGGTGDPQLAGQLTPAALAIDDERHQPKPGGIGQGLEDTGEVLWDRQLVNSKNNTTANIMTQATMLARAQMEQLENSDIDTSADLAMGTHTDPNNPIDETGAAGGIYTRTWTVSAGSGPDSREIEVTVGWNRRGQNRSVVLTTITRGN